jgi:hypothetical protein
MLRMVSLHILIAIQRTKTSYLHVTTALPRNIKVLLVCCLSGAENSKAVSA